MMKLSNLCKVGKEELALALILWKDFKSQGEMDVEIFIQYKKFAEMLGVWKKANELITKLPPFEIKEKNVGRFST